MFPVISKSLFGIQTPDLFFYNPGPSRCATACDQYLKIFCTYSNISGIHSTSLSDANPISDWISCLSDPAVGLDPDLVCPSVCQSVFSPPVSPLLHARTHRAHYANRSTQHNTPSSMRAHTHACTRSHSDRQTHTYTQKHTFKACSDVRHQGHLLAHQSSFLHTHTRKSVIPLQQFNTCIMTGNRF